MKKKILFVFGTRPEAIKLAPVIKEFQKSEKFQTKICLTSQHKSMLWQVLDLFELKGDFDLDIMEENQTLFDITAKILQNFKKILEEFNPHLVIVHGDTTTTFSASLGAFYKKIPVAHIEAGLRSYDLFNPFPEEANRKLTATLAKFHFAPTIKAAKNLEKEDIKKENILVTGNSVIDALFWSVEKLRSSKELYERIASSVILDFDFKTKYILVTLHRRENFDLLPKISQALREIAKSYKNLKIIFPVHLNPNVRDIIFKNLKDLENVYLIDPVNYLEFVFLMMNSYFIVSDSGGVQEEAIALSKPLLLLRDTTERPEAIESGGVKLIGTSKENIIKQIQILLEDKDSYLEMTKAKNPYGEGRASKKILEFLEKRL